MPQEPKPLETPTQVATPAQCEANSTHHRPVRLRWARLLKWVFEVDLQDCPNRPCCNAGRGSKPQIPPRKRSPSAEPIPRRYRAAGRRKCTQVERQRRVPKGRCRLGRPWIDLGHPPVGHVPSPATSAGRVTLHCSGCLRTSSHCGGGASSRDALPLQPMINGARVRPTDGAGGMPWPARRRLRTPCPNWPGCLRGRCGRGHAALVGPAAMQRGARSVSSLRLGAQRAPVAPAPCRAA